MPHEHPAPHDPFETLLADVVDHLVPEAFDRPTCAERVAREPVALVGLSGREAPSWFDRWVDDRLLEALERGAYESPLTVVVTSDGHLLRRYVDCGCGQLRCATVVAAREARAIAQPWLFGIDLVRPVPTPDPAAGLDPDAPDRGRWWAPWYAEARGRGLATTRAGALHLEGEVVVGSERFVPREDPVTRAFHRVLFAHPARRRFPLRRRR